MPAPVNPTIKAFISGRSPISSTRWWRVPVTVSFVCVAGSAPLVANCPAHVILTKSGKDQAITRSISAQDGGSATITESHINIDLTHPMVRITGITTNQHYRGVPHGINCQATDKILRHRILQAFSPHNQDEQG